MGEKSEELKNAIADARARQTAAIEAARNAALAADTVARGTKELCDAWQKVGRLMERDDVTDISG
jgi:hypothetical protein